MERDIPLKTSIDVAHMRRSCRIVEDAFHYLRSFLRPGITTLEINRIAEQFIISKGASPVLRGYKGFPCAICTSVNNVAAHGIPGDYVLEKGDIISIDITIVYEGWHGDAAWTFIIGSGSPDTERLIRAAWQANLSGIMAMKAGATIGDIGFEINKTANRHGCQVIQDYVGHGIGEDLHEEPRIPNVGQKGQGIRVVPGMVFTVEPIVTLGREDVSVLKDGWTIITADDSLSAQFEHTVAVFRDRIEILTLPSYNIDDYIDQPPFF